MGYLRKPKKYSILNQYIEKVYAKQEKLKLKQDMWKRYLKIIKDK